MRVVLLENIPGLGKKFDVKEVKTGYFRNFLLPQKLAAPATAAALKQKEEQSVREEERRQKLQAAAEKLTQETLKFHLKIGAKGEVFGSVTAADIEKALKEKGWEVRAVELAEPIRELGEKTATVDFGRGVKREIKVIVDNY